jgi:phosphomannomutase
VLLAAGLRVEYFADTVPTPMVAFAAKHLGAVAAVVITASHNPPAYNGYKVYAPNAAQIIPPVDGLIAAAIDAVGPAADIPREPDALSGSVPSATVVDDWLFDVYAGEVDEVRPDLPPDRDLRIVYTPLHGVGLPYVRNLLHRAGYLDLHPVAEQAEPDGRFPTVEFPNPEEPGALDLATGLAEELEADIIVANDPDADRLAISLRRSDGAWRPLTGNQIGLLLADYLLEHAPEGPTPLVISSIVSSPMLASIADHHGALFKQTLTGFKWIANAAMDLEVADTISFVCGYEEALGYTVGPVVRDKDGISAALVFADLAMAAKTSGTSVLERLAGLYRRHGLWVSRQKSIVRGGPEGKAEIDAGVVGLGDAPPVELGGFSVSAMTDYRVGAEDRPRWLPAQDLIALELDAPGHSGGGRVLMRPSGTEPKLKIYVDLRTDLDAGASVADAEAALTDRAVGVADALAAHVGLG